MDDQVAEILAASEAAGAPVVFALSRKRLGEVWGYRKRMSAVALLEVGPGGGGGWDGRSAGGVCGLRGGAQGREGGPGSRA